MSYTDKPAILCRNLTKEYHFSGMSTKALKGIDLEGKAGETLMLVGPSGCGKTTLISVLAGTLHLDSGQCLVLGYDIANLSEPELEEFRRKEVGFVFQSFNLIPTLTAEENVSIPLLLLGIGRAQAESRAREVLKLVGLEDKIKTLPGNLSGGQNQRVALARAIVHNPRLIVCDEPTSALDADTGRRVMEVMRDLAKKTGATLIIVTHDNRIFEFADRIVKMNDGVIVE